MKRFLLFFMLATCFSSIVHAQSPVTLKQLNELETSTDIRQMFANTDIKQLAYCRYFGMLTFAVYAKNMDFDNSAFPNLQPREAEEGIGVAYHADWGSPNLLFTNKKWVDDYIKEARKMGYKKEKEVKGVNDDESGTLFDGMKYTNIILTRKKTDDTNEAFSIVIYDKVVCLFHLDNY